MKKYAGMCIIGCTYADFCEHIVYVSICPLSVNVFQFVDILLIFFNTFKNVALQILKILLLVFRVQIVLLAYVCIIHIKICASITHM